MAEPEKFNPDSKCEYGGNHGKFTGVGQSVVALPNGLLIIYSVLCEKCGMVIINQQLMPTGSGIIMPDVKIQLKK